jgi:hypothetical protein
VFRYLMGVNAAVLLLLMTGCAHVVMNAPQSTMENAQRLRTTRMAPVNVGTFTLGAGMNPDSDKHMSVRGVNDVVPPDASFTQYLKATLAAELSASGLLDPNSNIVITGSLMDSKLSAPIGTGTGSIKAHFVVTRNGVKRYDRELTAMSSWDSPFIGAAAIPAAINEYQGLYRKMVAQLLDDQDFKAAVVEP